MSLEKVEGFSGLMKDTSSGGVVNVDKRSYNEYMKSKTIAQRNIQQQRATQETVQELQSEINTIKNDMLDIKMLLTQLIKGN